MVPDFADEGHPSEGSECESGIRRRHECGISSCACQGVRCCPCFCFAMGNRRRRHRQLVIAGQSGRINHQSCSRESAHDCCARNWESCFNAVGRSRERNSRGLVRGEQRPRSASQYSFWRREPEWKAADYVSAKRSRFASCDHGQAPARHRTSSGAGSLEASAGRTSCIPD